jgi:hypothetical protein
VIFFWLLAWFIAGAPQVEPWNTWFAFGLACAIGSLVGAHRARSAILVPFTPNTQGATSDSDDD